jgi:zinc protease
VKEKQLASNVGIFADARIGPSLLYLNATPRPGVDVADLEKGIEEEIAAVVKDGVTPEEFAKAKTQLERRYIDLRRSSLRTANTIGQYAVKYNDPGLINTILEKQNGVTIDQVNRAAKTYLVRDQRVVITTMPVQKSPAAAKPAP